MFNSKEIQALIDSLDFNLQVVEPSQREREAHAAVIMQRTMDQFYAAMAEEDDRSN